MEFLNQTRNKELYIHVVDTRGSTTMVDLELWESSASKLLSKPLLAPLPTLSSPPNVRILRANRSDRETEARLKTNLDLQELMIHYAACFKREGWNEIESGKKENYVWGHLNMTDEDNETWLAIFEITSLAQTEHYLASVRIFQEEN